MYKCLICNLVIRYCLFKQKQCLFTISSSSRSSLKLVHECCALKKSEPCLLCNIVVSFLIISSLCVYYILNLSCTLFTDTKYTTCIPGKGVSFKILIQFVSQVLLLYFKNFFLFINLAVFEIYHLKSTAVLLLRPATTNNTNRLFMFIQCYTLRQFYIILCSPRRCQFNIVHVRIKCYVSYQTMIVIGPHHGLGPGLHLLLFFSIS